MKNAKIEKFKCFNVCNGGVPTISRLRCLLVVDDCENKLPFYMQKRGVKIRHHHDIMFNIIVFSTLVVNPLLSLYMFMVFNMFVDSYKTIQVTLILLLSSLFSLSLRECNGSSDP